MLQDSRKNVSGKIFIQTTIHWVKSRYEKKYQLIVGMIFDIIFNYLIWIIAGYLIGDLVVGIFHWMKDTYFDPFTPILGGIFIWGSRLHHIRPGYVTEFDDYDLIMSSGKWTLLWMGPFMYYIDFSMFSISLFLTIAANDMIHKYSHMTEKERPEWTTILQNMYVFQSVEEHHLHHTYPHDTHYCPITPFWNNILEHNNFWKRLENFIELNTGMKPRQYQNEFVEDKRYPGGIKFIESSNA